MLALTYSLLLLASPTPAQTVGGGSEVLYQWDGADAGDRLGWSTAGAGDVNGDGYDDVIIGAHEAAFGSLAKAGEAMVYSGFDGSLLYQWHGTQAYELLGSSVAGAGDLNHDGFDDVLVAALEARPTDLIATGSVFAYSGADGSQLFRWDGSIQLNFFGRDIAGVGDVNQDGFPDVMIGAEGSTTGLPDREGAAYVYSGADGSLIYQWNGEADGDWFGSAVSSAGDANADGVPDLMVGAPFFRSGPVDLSGAVYLYSGADGTLIRTWRSAEQFAYWGRSIASAGDVNGDGFDDQIIGSDWASPGGFQYAGTALVFSGMDGSVLHQWQGQSENHQLGASVANAGDVDHDGVPDILVSAYGSHPGDDGSIYLYSGLDGSLIHRWVGGSGDDGFGASVACVGDLNQDGLPDMIVGALDSNPGGLASAGSAFAFTWNPYLQSTADTISDTSAALIGLELSFPQDAAFYEYRVLLSASGTSPFFFGVDIPLTVDNLLVSAYFGAYPFPLSSSLQGILDANARATATFGKLASAPSGLVGTTFHLAAVANQPGQLPGFSSIAVAFEIIP